MIYNSSEIVFLDSVQYNRRSWQNRTHIRDNHNLDKKKLISISVEDYHRDKKIIEYKINKNNIQKLKENLWQSYKDTRYFKEIINIVLEVLNNNINYNLAQINFNLIKAICDYLNININYTNLSELNLRNKKENLILEILKKRNADLYLANDGSLKYASKDFFVSNGFKFKTHNYKHPNYIQKNKGSDLKFLSHLSILDLLFNYQKKAEVIIKSNKINFF